MSLASGVNVFGLDGAGYRLSREIGRGGQGSVWSLDGRDDLVAKFYHSGLGEDDIAKLSAMCRLKNDALTSVAAWPLTLLRSSRSGKPHGLLMRKIAGFHPVHQLYGMKSRLKVFPDAQLPFLVHTAINTARAFATIHAAGQVIGDVNHSNLMVSRNATVALIDCDSFQISDGQRVFRCPVGVPEFTPPELQGASFLSQERTVAHDSFGLSILIFYLLFLGRHPYMGVYSAQNDEMVPLDAAIGQYAFPYALDCRSPLVKLPPFVPRLSDYPPSITSLFTQSFTRDALSCGRPSAGQWVSALTALGNALKHCPINPSHHFHVGLAECPWCRMEGVVGRAIFGISLTVSGDSEFSLSKLWTEIESIRPTAEVYTIPNLNQLASTFEVDAGLPEIIKRRRKYRLASLGLATMLSLWAGVALSPTASIVAIAAAFVVASMLWTRGSLPARPYIEAYESALLNYRETAALLERTAEPPSTFVGEKRKLEDAKKGLEDLGPQKAQRVALLNAGREQKQRQYFLERFRIEDATIQGIGPKNKLILSNWGIEDAWDIDLARIGSIKGFGPVKQKALLSWRSSLEKGFRFDRSLPVDPRDLHALEQEFVQRKAAMQNTLQLGPQTLRQALGVWRAQRRQVYTKLNASATALAKASLNRRALRTL